MAKYNEVMEHVVVSDEMQSRILRNVDQHFAREKSRRRKIWVPILATAAAAAALILVIRPWNAVQITPPDTATPPGVALVHEEQEYPSAAELSQAVGFEAAVIANLPFEVTKTEYRSVFGMAEIRYIGEENTITVRKSAGTEDNSGDYNTYETEKTVTTSGTDITLKGNSDGMVLALWTDGTWAYSIRCQSGLSEEVLTGLAEEIIP